MTYLIKYEDLGFKDYKATWDYQEAIFNNLVSQKINKTGQSEVKNNNAQNVYITVEHPHVFTLGKSGSENNLLINSIQLRAKDAVFYKTDRGGDITYHGPGQIVGYPIFDLGTMKLSLKEYVHKLEEVIILTIKDFGIEGNRLAGATGVWLDTDIPQRTRKICAIGVRASRFVTMHGFAFNVNTDLTYFSYINPCGFVDKGVTSLAKELGSKQDMITVRNVVKEKMMRVFDIEWIN